MYRNSWQSEFLQFCTILGLLTAFGMNAGHTLLGVCGGLLLVIIVLYHRIFQFYQWLNDRSNEQPTDYGVISNSAAYIQRREAKYNKVIAKHVKTIEQLNQGLESLNDGLLVLNAAGYILNMNSSAQLYLNLRRQDIGQQIRHLLRFPSFIKYLNSAHFSEPLELDIERRTYLLHVTKFGGNQRLVLIRDITERRRVETMRQNFIADVSHELRTPLTVINGYLELLQGQLDSLPGPLAPALDNMQIQGQRMTLLINDLIELSKLESVGRERKSEVFNLTELCQRTADHLGNLRDGCQLTLTMDADVVLEGFESEISSAISNLVANAIKYGDGSRVDLSLCRHRNGYEFAVKDYGDGIKLEHIDRLTERFYRVDSSRESKVGGSGLGLAIVKHALENHDTQLHIESQLGQGSRFSFVLPEARIHEVVSYDND